MYCLFNKNYYKFLNISSKLISSLLILFISISTKDFKYFNNSILLFLFSINLSIFLFKLLYISIIWSLFNLEISFLTLLKILSIFIFISSGKFIIVCSFFFFFCFNYTWCHIRIPNISIITWTFKFWVIILCEISIWISSIFIYTY